MDVETVKHKLEEDIHKLRDWRGFIRAGSPRFNVLFGRDSLITSWQLMDYNPEIAAVTLKILAALQSREIDPERDADPGKILHEMWDDESTDDIETLHLDRVPYPYYGSIDSTPLFVIVAEKYFEKTKDEYLIKKIWPNLVKAKNWILSHGDSNNDDFLDYERKNPNGPYNQGWKDGKESPQFGKRPIALVEVQGYKYEALRAFSVLSNLVAAGKDLVPLDYIKRFQEKFLNKFFWPDEQYFYLAIDGDENPYGIIASNAGHLLFTNLITKSYKEKIVRRLFQKDLWTPYGIRTHSKQDKDFQPFSYQLGSVWPYDNWLIAEGLRASGFLNEYQIVKESLFRAYSELGHLPELYAVTENDQLKKIPRANPLQAWSSAGLLNLLIRE